MAGRLGASVKETEILIGVLAATVRDPSRSGPGARLTHGLTHPKTHRRRRATQPHFHAYEASQKEKEAWLNLVFNVAADFGEGFV